MRTDLTPEYNQAVDLLITWRNRYSKVEYPFKIAVNIFYRQYTMNSIWNTELINSFYHYKGVESDVLKSFELLETAYSNASAQFATANGLYDLMNKNEDVGGINYKDIFPIVIKAQTGDNAAVEELEFSYLFYFLCNKATLLWAAFGRKGFSQIGAITQTTGAMVADQPITYSVIFAKMGQLGCAEIMNSLYTPLRNLYEF
jgi:hypothetical protein